MRTIKTKAIVQNKPDYPLKKYIVCRAVEGQLWFWGTWDDLNTALKVAKEFENGCVVENVDLTETNWINESDYDIVFHFSMKSEQDKFLEKIKRFREEQDESTK